jgi:hypothetical protein
MPITVYSDNHIKPLNTPYGHGAEFLNVESRQYVWHQLKD